MILYDVIHDEEESDDALCLFSCQSRASQEMIALICELSEYVYTCVPCRIYFQYIHLESKTDGVHD